MRNDPPHSRQRTLMRDALLGSAFCVSCVVYKIAIGLGPGSDKLSVIALAAALGAIGGGVLHFTRSYMQRGTRQYYASWALAGGVVGAFADALVSFSDHADVSLLWANGFFFVIFIIAGIVIGKGLRERKGG